MIEAARERLAPFATRVDVRGRRPDGAAPAARGERRRDPLDRDVPLDPGPRPAVPAPRPRRCGRAAGSSRSAAGTGTSPRSAPRSPTSAATGRTRGPSRRPRTRAVASRPRGSRRSTRGSATSRRPSQPGAPMREFLRTVVLGAHVERPGPRRRSDAFLDAVAARLPEPAIDYVRLNILATARPERPVGRGMPPPWPGITMSAAASTRARLRLDRRLVVGQRVDPRASGRSCHHRCVIA